MRVKPIYYCLISPFILSSLTVDADDTVPDEILVVSQRLVPLMAHKSYASTIITKAKIDTSPTIALDQLLAGQAGVGLFKRSDSSSSHPTTTGISMRGTGANAAGRTLVLLDGMPLNGPFGGWITWSAIDVESLERIEMTRGGGAGVYGSSALAGVISLNSENPVENTISAEGIVGNYGTYGGQAHVDFAGENGFISVSGGAENKDGFYLLSPSQRGTIDVPSSSDNAFATLRAGTHVADDVSLTARLAWYRDSMVNGLSLATSETEGVDASLRLVRLAQQGQLGFEVTAYYRHKDFNNSFSSVQDAARTIERIVLNQYDVPGSGAGFMAKVRHIAGNGVSYDMGVDVRHMRGAAHEDFKNLGAGFLNERLSAGRQQLAGFFTEAAAERENWTITAGFRLDHYKSYDGVIIETNKASSMITRDDVIDIQDGWVPSARLGFTYDITGAFTFESAIYNGFRLPTINEYYRPFRVRNDITEANPTLDIERILGLEAGVSYQPLSTLSFSARYFHLRLRDGVGNITLAYGPGVFPPTGFVPNGGVLRQRENIDETITDGFEISGNVMFSHGISLEGSYQFVHARITKFDNNASLIDNKPIQTPKHSLRGSFKWQPRSDYWLRADLQLDSAVFDDDLNERELSSIVMAHLSAGYMLTENITIKTVVRNIFDEKVIAALSDDGLETLAQPRSWTLSLGLKF
jgi:vitamin B12 transporter